MASEQAIRHMNHLHSRGRAERIVYHPADGLAREIVCLVDRGDMEPNLNSLSPQFSVTALNDEQHGIASTLLDIGKDSLDVSERHGKTPVNRGIQRVLRHDGEFITLEVQ
jgi:hypothetical protein